MVRDLNKLSVETFDILIVGGGIHGAALAWLASLENYKVGLIEKNDFCSGTSSQSQKIIHGGLRYLADLDFGRVSQSIRERTRLLWIAPHLADPMPCVIPVYRHGFKGAEGMRIGLKLFNFLGRKGNKLPDTAKHFPESGFISKKEVLDLIPGIDPSELLGGAKWYDGFCRNTERLVLSYIKSASLRGAIPANYVSAEKLIVENNKAEGIAAVDNLTGESFFIKAKNIVDCTGTWINEGLFSSKLKSSYPMISGINIVTEKIFDHETAVGLTHPENKSRYYFIAPWGEKSIIGTEWFYENQHSGSFKADNKECTKLLDNLRSLNPSLKINLQDIKYVQKGFVFGNKTGKDPSASLNDYFIEGPEENSVHGLYNVIGVKFTTAAYVAEEVIRKINPSVKRKEVTDYPKLHGGEIENTSRFNEKIKSEFGGKARPEDISWIGDNYGTDTKKIFNMSNKFYERKDILSCLTEFSIEEEMACSLSDVILRRTGIGSSGLPDDREINFIADIMAMKLNWNGEKKEKEINQLRNHYPAFISGYAEEKIIS